MSCSRTLEVVEDKKKSFLFNIIVKFIKIHKKVSEDNNNNNNKTFFFNYIFVALIF